MTGDITGQDAAVKAVRAYTTPRMLWMSKLRAYVAGTQYDNRVSWHDKSVPVWDRAPAIVWQAAEGAITSNEDLLLGEGRYPSISSKPSEDNGDDDELLDEESSKAIDRLIVSIEKEACLRAHNREQYGNAQSVGTCVGIIGCRGGRLFAWSALAEYCEWELNENEEVVRLTISYPYIDRKKGTDGRWYAVAKVFRRVIDAVRDVTFLPAEANQNGTPIVWVEDPKLTIEHGLGFCPVVVHKFRAPKSLHNETDGRAIHATVLDEIDAYCLQASIRHDGAIHSLPQKYEIGVDRGYNPTGAASYVDPGLVATATGKAVNPLSNPIAEHYSARKVPDGARMQGPGSVWQYSNPDTKVGQLEISEGALRTLAETMANLKSQIAETLCWVALNPDEIKFAAALSGKAIERMMARQLNRVAKDRDGFGNGYIIPICSMLLRVVAKIGPQLRTRGVKKALPSLLSFVESTANSDGSVSEEWNAPPLSLKWGAWFAPTPEDEAKIIDTAAKAKDAQLITQRTAVEHIARSFGIDDVSAYLDALKEEVEGNDEEENERAARAIALAHANLANGATRKRGSEGEPKADSKGGSGSGVAAADATKKETVSRAIVEPNRKI